MHLNAHPIKNSRDYINIFTKKKIGSYCLGIMRQNQARAFQNRFCRGIIAFLFARVNMCCWKYRSCFGIIAEALLRRTTRCFLKHIYIFRPIYILEVKRAILKKFSISSRKLLHQHSSGQPNASIIKLDQVITNFVLI